MFFVRLIMPPETSDAVPKRHRKYKKKGIGRPPKDHSQAVATKTALLLKKAAHAPGKESPLRKRTRTKGMLGVNREPNSSAS